MRLTRLLTSISLLFILGACGSKTHELSKPEIGDPIPLDEEKITYIMSTLNFQIAPIKQDRNTDEINVVNAPSGVARLLILNREDARKSGYCTGFLVDSKTLVTNHHCVESQQICDDTYIGIYNGNGGYLQAKCKKIIHSYEDYHKPSDLRRSLDFAILELDKEVAIQPMPLANTPMEANDKVTVWAVDHNIGKIIQRSRITQLNCVVNEQSRRRATMLKNCPIIGGNSGSPILNENGEVVGVIWGSKVSKIYDASSDLDKRRNTKHGESAAATDITHILPYL